MIEIALINAENSCRRFRLKSQLSLTYIHVFDIHIHTCELSGGLQLVYCYFFYFYRDLKRCSFATFFMYVPAFIIALTCFFGLCVSILVNTQVRQQLVQHKMHYVCSVI